MNEQTKFALDLIQNSNARSVLNIGYRHDSDDNIEKYCRNNNIDFVILEAFEPNCVEIRNHRRLRCINADIRDIKTVLAENFDIIQWLHGPEHLLWEDFLKCRHDIESKASKLVLYQAPIGIYPQEALYDNIYERHLTTLYPNMFAELGYKIVLHDKNGEFTFSAISKKTL